MESILRGIARSEHAVPAGEPTDEIPTRRPCLPSSPWSWPPALERRDRGPDGRADHRTVGRPRRLSGSLTIYGASSLKAALTKAQTAFMAANPGVTVTISTDSSSTLETQIEQGAPADVFLSADTTNPGKLVTKGLTAGSPVNFAGNLLTVIVADGQPGRASPARPTWPSPGSR